ncbi:MAG: hypothetical protein U1A27_05110 [Phycisphaerae bacterium]
MPGDSLPESNNRPPNAVAAQPIAALAFLIAAGLALGFALAGPATDRPDRFATIEPDRIYRGAYPHPHELRWLASDLGIRGVVSLMKEAPTAPRAQAERRTAVELKLSYREFELPGDGLAGFDTLDAAADAIDELQRIGPVYLHCAAGKQRSNAATAVYRMRHCGWTAEQAIDELARRYGLDRAAEAALCDHLRRYYRERIAGTAPAAR